MKLSDIKGDATFDVLADIIEPIVNIASDSEVSKLFQREKAPEGVEPRTFALTKVKTYVPVLLRSHKSDLILILATLNMQEPDEYAEGLGMSSLAKDVMELMTDEEFLGFLS